LPRSAAEIVARAKASVQTVSCQEAAARIARERGLLLLDVREPDEYARGSVPGAVNVPRGVLEMRIGALAPDEDQPLLVHCSAGGRAALAAATLQDMGYRRVAAVDGSFEELRSCCARPPA
jgi:rhodanese-related sulfurtransferase